MVSEGYKYEVYDELNKEELASTYANFEEKINHVSISTSFRWIRKWWELFHDSRGGKFGEGKKPLIIFIYKNQSLIMIAPFVLVNVNFHGLKFRVIQFISQQWGATYCDILSQSVIQDDLKFLWKTLGQVVKFDLLLLDHIPSFSKNFEKSTLIPYEVCPEVEVHKYDNMESFRKMRYSKSLKQNLRTSINRSKKEAKNLTKCIEKQTPENFQDVIQISATKSIDGKTDKYADPVKRRFRYEIMNDFESSFCFVMLDNKKVSYRTNIIYNNIKFCFDAAYHRDFPYYELGAHAVDHNIEDSFLQEFTVHCMGPGSDEYKFKYSTNSIKLCYYIRAGNTFKSIFLLVILKVQLRIKSRIFTRNMLKRD